MKDDAPAPNRIPKKRRVLEDPNATLDRWLAEWLERGDITPSERRRIAAERERRHAAARATDITVGVVIGREGITPAQRERMAHVVASAKPTALVLSSHAPFSGLLTVVRGLVPDVAVVGAPDDQAVVRSADIVVAGPKEPTEPVNTRRHDANQAGVWAGVKYARHRSVPVRIVMPDGGEV